jgi:hypothetical protein
MSSKNTVRHKITTNADTIFPDTSSILLCFTFSIKPRAERRFRQRQREQRSSILANDTKLFNVGTLGHNVS